MNRRSSCREESASFRVAVSEGLRLTMTRRFSMARNARHFYNLYRANPKWSDARAVRALKEAGARFGPDDKAEFEKVIP
jgi:hypothetical protein